MTTPTDLLLIAETIGNRTQPSSEDLLGAARAWSAAGGGTVRLLLPGTDVAAPAAELAAATLDTFTLEHPDLNLPNPALTAALLGQVLPQIRPRYIGLPHTMRGIQLAAALAVQLCKPVVTGVEGIVRSDGRLHFRRALFNGKLNASLAVPATGAIFTCPGMGTPQPGGSLPGKGRVIPLPVGRVDCNVRTLGMSPAADDETPLEEAAVIVAAGRGIGGEENLAGLQAVAGIMNNSTLGGSRTACDAGWLPYSRQVGETGRRVAPELYLACGISGARQHLAGIKNAKLVVAVNSDPRAAIFSRADFGIVADVNRLLPKLLELYRERVETGER